MKNFFIYWLPAIVWAGLIFFLSSIPDLRSDLFETLDLIFRKLAHMFEYAVLAVLFIRIGTYKKFPVWSVYLGAIIACLTYALIDEWHQSFVVGRYASIGDIGIDLNGAITGAVIWINLRINPVGKKE